MKYIITENRLNEFMTNYFNNLLDNYLVRTPDGFIVLSNVTQDDDWYDIMGYDFSDGRLWINDNIIQTFDDLFNLDKNASHDFIKNWFENQFDVKIKFVES
jgi:hypothetical protein